MATTPKHRRNPIDPKTGKRKVGRPRKHEAAAKPLHPPPPPPRPPPTPAATTDSNSSIDRAEDLARALAELEPREPGAGEGQAGAASSTAAPHPDEPAPILTPEDLVAGAEVLSGLGVALYALLTRRSLPSEERLKLSEEARRFCGITAPGTLKAAGPVLAENPWLVTWGAPTFFCGTIMLHVVRRVLEVRETPQRERKPPPRPVEHETAPDPARNGHTPNPPPPIPQPGAMRLFIPPIPEPMDDQ